MDAENITAYRCTVCRALYDDQDDAMACHGASEPVEAYSCSRCGTIYAKKEEADACCSAKRL